MTDHRRPQTKLNDLEYRALWYLFDRFMNSDRPVVGPDDMLKALSNIPYHVWELVLESLEERRQVKSVSDPMIFDGSADGYQITRSGIEFVEQWGHDFYSEVAAGDSRGSNVDSESDRTGGALAQPGMDSWEPLPIESSPEFEQLRSGIEETLRLARQDNGYAANHSDERNYVIGALEVGLKALEIQTEIYQVQFHAFIWEPIVRLADRFSGHAIGMAAQATKETIKEVFKDFLKQSL